MDKIKCTADIHLTVPVTAPLSEEQRAAIALDFEMMVNSQPSFMSNKRKVFPRIHIHMKKEEQDDR